MTVPPGEVDIDHPDPFDRHGPPGQTGTHNGGLLGRTHQQAKTQLGYSVNQTGPGEYVWRTPHGLRRLVDQRGTHRIGEDDAYLLSQRDRALDEALGRLLAQTSRGPARCTPPDHP